MSYLSEMLRNRHWRFKDLIGAHVFVHREFETRDGTRFREGEKLKIEGTHQGRFHVRASGRKYARRVDPYNLELEAGTCAICGCTDDDCSGCIERTGEPCHWVDSFNTLCSACVGKD